MDISNPPADPNEWIDEQWIEWLVATDEAAEIGAAQRGGFAEGNCWEVRAL